MTVLSSSVSAPSISSSTSLFSSIPKSCTRRRKRSKVVLSGSMRMLIEFSRSSAVNRSTASAISAISASSKRADASLRRACTVTSSPTTLISPSSLSAETRMDALFWPAAFGSAGIFCFPVSEERAKAELAAPGASSITSSLSSSTKINTSRIASRGAAVVSSRSQAR